MLRITWAVLSIACASTLCAQLPPSSILTTFAGSAWRFTGNNQPAVDAPISSFAQLSTDTQGNVIFADYGNHFVSRLNADGTLTELAGNGILGFSGDGGPALSASLNRPTAAVMSASGYLYIYDSSNARIRMVTPQGIISTYAGNGIAGSGGNNGPAAKASISSGPGKLAIDPSGNLYLTDPDSGAVRRITPDGTISIYAGNGKSTHSGDGIPATQAGLALGTGQIVCDSGGNLYVAEAQASQIRKVTPDGKITTIAGTGVAGYKDGPALSAQFNMPVGLTVDQSGNIYVGDQGNHVVRQISPSGAVTTIAGVPGQLGFSGDGGPGLKAMFRFPDGVAIDGNGAINISDSGNLRIRALNPSANIIATVAGNGQWRTTPDGTPAALAYFFAPLQISFDSKGNLLIADSQTYRIRRVNTDGTFQTLAGSGAEGVGGIGGPATRALLSEPRMAIADNSGNIYIADSGAGVVYRIGSDGNLTLFAGQTGAAGSSGDGGPAAKATLNAPYALALDAAHNLYIADTGAHCIRMVAPDPANTMTTFAGACGKAGYAGVNGMAKQALFDSPKAIVFDSQGNLIVGDTNNNRIRKITPAGVISTIAGTGAASSNGDGSPAISSAVFQPDSLAVDLQGTIYFGEGAGDHVRAISPEGTLSTVAGSGFRPLAGDGGAAIYCSLAAQGLAIDARGNLYISDSYNDRIRIMFASAPMVSLAQSSLTFSATSGGTPTDPQPIALASTLSGQLLTAMPDSPWIQASDGIQSTPQKLQVAVDPSTLAAGVYHGKVTLQTPGVPVDLATIAVTATVVAPAPPKLGVDAQALNFSFLRGGATQTQSFNVQNNGGGTLGFEAAAISAGVTLSQQSGSVAPNKPVTVVVTVDPAALPDGVSLGQIVLHATTGDAAIIPITVTIQSRGSFVFGAPPPSPVRRMVIPQRGLLFTAVQGGGVTPPQTFPVLNTGDASFSYTAAAFPVSGGGWLDASSGAGLSSPSALGSVTVSVDATGLDPGVYYGLVRVSSTGTVNSPQDVEVVLNVFAPDFDPGAVVSPTGLVFTATPGNSNPGSQKFTITNLSPSAAQFALRPIPLGGTWIVVAPDGGTLAAGASQTITVQASVGSLTPGVYDGSIAMQIGHVPRSVAALFVVAPGAPPSPAAGGSIQSELPARAAAAACAPTALYPVFTSLVQDFSVPANWPIPVEVSVVDDCGNPITTGRVVTSFSNGDPPVSLTSLNDGRWQGTWFGRASRSSQIVISAAASMDSPRISGRFNYTGTLQTNMGIPAVNADGVTTSAASIPVAPLSPGSVISINGNNLALGKNPAQLPLATALSGTEVLLGGELLPLLYTSDGLINAIVPYDLRVNAQYEIVVMSGGAISGPQTVTLAAAQPGIFAIDNTGSTQIAQDVWNHLTTGVAPNSISTPTVSIGSGDNIVIYCTGLGDVNQTVDPTTGAPGSVATTNPVTVSIGSQNATPSFAGLVPGYTGLYQVNVTVPSGVASGSAVIVVTVAGESSAPVNVTVR